MSLGHYFMKWHNSFAVVVRCIAVSLMAVEAQAQSTFASFYEQTSACYESHPLGSQSDVSKVIHYANSDFTDARSNWLYINK